MWTFVSSSNPGRDGGDGVLHRALPRLRPRAPRAQAAQGPRPRPGGGQGAQEAPAAVPAPAQAGLCKQTTSFLTSQLVNVKAG